MTSGWILHVQRLYVYGYQVLEGATVGEGCGLCALGAHSQEHLVGYLM